MLKEKVDLQYKLWMCHLISAQLWVFVGVVMVRASCSASGYFLNHSSTYQCTVFAHFFKQPPYLSISSSCPFSLLSLSLPFSYDRVNMLALPLLISADFLPSCTKTSLSFSPLFFSVSLGMVYAFTRVHQNAIKTSIPQAWLPASYCFLCSTALAVC